MLYSSNTPQRFVSAFLKYSVKKGQHPRNQITAVYILQTIEIASMSGKTDNIANFKEIPAALFIFTQLYISPPTNHQCC